MEVQEFITDFNEMLTILCEDYPENCLIGAFDILIKLFENIILNPFVDKYRLIKTNNKVIQSNLMNIENIELLLEGIGYTKVGIHEYEFQSDNVSRISIILQLLKDKVFQLRLSSLPKEEREKQMEILKRKKESMMRQFQKESFREEIASKAKLDRIEKKEDIENKPYQKGKSLQFGAKTNTFKDIGVDLSKQKGG